MTPEKQMAKAIYDSMDVVFTQILNMILIGKATPEQIMEWILFKRTELKNLLDN